MNIFVGNLSFDSTGADVKKLFEGFGNVASAVIVTRKEKKGPKSRGFGFVQMPDEQQALAAIAALNGKEFMGRVLNVNPARPKGQKAMVWPPIAKAKGQKAMVWPPIAKAKTEAHREIELKKKMQPKVEAEAGQYPREETEQKKAWFSPVFNKPGTYKGGRRSRSYMKQHGLTVMEDTKPRRRSQDNPMRWRKRGDQPKPWQKSLGEHKPWKKAEEGARPWKKAEGESKPWKKTGGEIRTWRKSGEEPKPWKKPAGESKPWRKSKKRPRPRQSRIESRRKPGGYTR